MTDLRTERLLLHAVDETEAGRVAAGTAGPGDAWAADYPFGGDRAAVGGFLRATGASGEQRPFGYYQITRRSDGLVVGGVGFKGRPHDGRVEVGYGLAPSARGNGYAAEALQALLTLAADNGVATVVADTTADNVASQRTLTGSGFVRVRSDAELLYYEIELAPPAS